MVETNAILNLEMKGQSKVLDALESVSENFDTLGKNTKESVTQFGELNTTLKDQPKQFNVVAKASDGFKNSITGAGAATRSFNDNFSKTTSALSKGSSVYEAVDNGFVSLGARVLGVNKNFSVLKDLLGATVEPYDRINEGNSTLSKSMRAVTVFGDPARQTIDVIATSADTAANSLSTMGSAGEKAASVLKVFGGSLNKVSGDIGKAKLAAQVVLLGESMTEFAKKLPENFEQLQEIYAKAEEFGLLNQLFGTTQKKLSAFAYTYQAIYNSTNAVKSVFGVQNDPNGLLNLATKTWIQLMAYNETIKIFRTLTKTIYDTALQLQGISSGFGTIAAMGIDTQFAEMAVQIGTMGAALIANGQAAEKFAQKSIAVFAQFEDKLSEIMVLADGAALGFNNLATNLSKIANNLNHSITTLELAGAQYTAISAGFTDPAFLASVSKFSKAMSVDITTSAETAARMLRIFRLEARETATVLAQAKAVLDQGILTGSDYASVMGQVAGVAKSSGLSLEQTNVMLQRLTTLGFSAADAGQGLMSLLGSIAGQGAESANAVKALGINFNELRIRSDGLVAPLNELVEATGGSIARMKEIIPDALALRTAMALATIETKEYNAAVTKMGQTGPEALDEAFGTRTQSLIERSTALMNGFREEIQELGMRLAESKFLDAPLKFLENLLERFQKAPDSLKNFVTALIGGQIIITRMSGAIDNLTKVLFNIGKAYVITRATMLLFNKTLQVQTIAAIQNARAGTISWGVAINNILGLQKTQLQLLGGLGAAQKGLAAINGFFTKTLFGQTTATQTQTAATTQLTLAQKAQAIATKAQIIIQKTWTNVLKIFNKQTWLNIIAQQKQAAETWKQTAAKNAQTKATTKLTLAQKLNNIAYKARMIQAKIYFETINNEYYLTLKKTIATLKDTIARKANEVATKTSILTQKVWNTAVIVGNKNTWITVAALAKATIAQKANATATALSANATKTLTIVKTLLNKKTWAEIGATTKLIVTYQTHLAITKAQTTATNAFNFAKSLLNKNTYAQIGATLKLNLALVQNLKNTNTAIIATKLWGTATGVVTTATTLLTGVIKKLWAAFGPIAVAVGAAAVAFSTLQDVIGKFIPAIGGVAAENRKTADAIMKVSYSMSSLKKETEETQQQFEHYSGFLNTKVIPALQFLTKWNPVIAVSRLGSELVDRMFGTSIRKDADAKIDGFFTGLKDNIQAYINGPLYEAFDVASKAIGEEFDRTIKIDSIIKSGEVYSAVAKEIIAANEGRALSGQELESVILAEKKAIDTQLKNNDELIKSYEELITEIDDPKIKKAYLREIDLLNQRSSALQRNWEAQKRFLQNTNAIKEAIERNNAALSTEAFLKGIDGEIGIIEKSFNKLEGILENIPQEAKQSYLEMENVLSDSLNLTSSTQRRTAVRLTNLMTEFYANIGQVAKDANFQTLTELNADAERSIEAIKDSVAQGVIDQDLAKTMVQQIIDQEVEIDGVKGSPLRNAIIDQAYSALDEIEKGSTERRIAFQKEYIEEYKSLENQKIIASEIVAKRINEINEKILKDSLQTEQNILNRLGRTQGQDTEAYEKQARVVSSIQRQVAENQREAIDAQLNYEVAIRQKTIDKISAIEAAGLKTQQAARSEIAELTLQINQKRWQTQRRLLKEVLDEFGEDSEEYKAKLLEVDAATASVQKSQIEATKAANEKVLQDLQDFNALAVANLELAVLAGNESRTKLIEEQAALERQELEVKFNNLQAEIEEVKAKNGDVTKLEAEASRIRISIYQNEISTIERLQDRLVKQNQNRTEAAKQMAQVEANALQLITDQLELQQKLRQEQNASVKAVLSQTESQASSIADLSSNESIQAQASEQAAKVRLDALRQSQNIERENLEIQRQQNLLALEREKIQLRISKLDNQAAIFAAEAELAKARAAKVEEEQLQAIQLQITALQEQSNVLGNQESLLTARVEQEEQIFNSQKLQLNISQQSAKVAAEQETQLTTMRSAHAAISHELQIQKEEAETQLKIQNAIAGFVKSSNDSVAAITQSETLRAKITADNAALEVQNLTKRQAIEQQSLEQDKIRQQLLIEEEQIRTQIAIAQNQQLQTEAEINRIKAESIGDTKTVDALAQQIASLETQEGLLLTQQQSIEQRAARQDKLNAANKIELQTKQQVEKIEAERAKALADIEVSQSQTRKQLKLQSEQLEQNSKLFEAISNFTQSQSSSIESATSNEAIRAKAAAINANVQLQTLQQRQAFEQKQLEIQQEQNKVSLESERLQTNIAIAQNKQLKTELNLQIAKAGTNTQLKQALQQQLAAVESQSGLLQSQLKSLDEREKRQQRANQVANIELRLKQESEAAQAKINQLTAEAETAQAKITQELELQKQTLEIREKVTSAINDYYQSSVNLVGKITQNEETAAYLRSASAAQALKSLEERQELEQLNLEIEIRRNEMAVEREAIQTKIAIAQNQQAIAMSAMEAARARSRGDEKSAKNIERAAIALGQQSKLLEEQAVWVEQRAAMMADQNDASRVALGLQQSSAKAEAEIEMTLAKQEEARTRLNKQIERELELIDGAKGAFQSQLDSITGSLNAASSLTDNEQEQKILARTTAQIKLEALSQQQEMETRVLKLQQQQKTALLEQEEIRIRVQQAQTVADVAKSQAELEKAKASGASVSMIRALQMQVEAGMVQGTALQMAGQGLSQQRSIQKQLFEFERGNLSRSQALQTQEARIDLANTLPTRLRQRARNQIMFEILGDFTGNPITGAGRFDRREAMRRLDARAMSGALGQFGTPRGFNEARFAARFAKRAGMTQGLNPQMQMPNMELTPVSTEDARKNFESQLAEIGGHTPQGEIEHRQQRDAKEDEFRNIVVSTLESIAKKDFNVSQTNSITNNVSQATPTQDVEKEMLDFTQNLFSKTKSLLS